MKKLYTIEEAKQILHTYIDKEISDLRKRLMEPKWKRFFRYIINKIKGIIITEVSSGGVKEYKIRKSK